MEGEKGKIHRGGRNREKEKEKRGYNIHVDEGEITVKTLPMPLQT